MVTQLQECVTNLWLLKFQLFFCGIKMVQLILVGVGKPKAPEGLVYSVYTLVNLPSKTQ